MLLLVLPRLDRKKSRFSIKLNKALNDNGSDSKSGSNKIRNIILLALMGAGGIVVAGKIYHYCKSNDMTITIIPFVSKCKSTLKSMLPSEKSLDVNTAVETSKGSNATGKTARVIGISIIVIVTSLKLFGMLTEGKASIDIDDIDIIDSVPMSWWDKLYPVRVVGGAVMFIAGSFCQMSNFPPLQIFGISLMGTGWQIATNWIPSYYS